MMTGLYPSHHGAGVSKPALQSDSTLAQLLRQAGYHTAGFAGGDLCSHRFGLSRGFSFYRDPDSFETRGPQMLSYLEEFLRSQSESSPLFVFANFFDPHAPYGADPEFRSRFGVDEARRRLASDPSDPWYRIDVAYTGSLRLLFEGEVPMTEEGLSYVHGAYQAEVAFMDQQLGLFFDQLRERELFDPALIILVADHGELLGEYGGLFSHAGRLDPELTEIPLLVKWPGQRQGVKVPQLVSQVDLFATILEAAGLAVPANDGTPLPRAAAEVRRRRLFLEEHESQIHPLPPRLKLASHVYGIQLPRWRQVVWDGSGQCARLLEGRWSPEPCREAPQRVLSRLQEMLGEADRGEPVGQMSLEVEQSLRALGYL
jgi:arylsulfatase A-like enzyme